MPQSENRKAAKFVEAQYRVVCKHLRSKTVEISVSDNVLFADFV